MRTDWRVPLKLPLTATRNNGVHAQKTITFNYHRVNIKSYKNTVTPAHTIFRKPFNKFVIDSRQTDRQIGFD